MKYHCERCAVNCTNYCWRVVNQIQQTKQVNLPDSETLYNHFFKTMYSSDGYEEDLKMCVNVIDLQPFTCFALKSTDTTNTGS